MLWFALICTVVVGLSYGAYWIAFYNPEARHGEAVFTDGNKDASRLETLYAEMEAIPYEQVYIQSMDGLRLSGRYYHISDDANLHIQFHGYRGSGIRDFSAGNAIARKLGLNTLVVDQRAHGKSQGNTVTFGIKERCDCLCWAKYAAERFGPDTAVFLSGVSMGGATVVMASDLDLPENVAGIIADCPYESPGAIIRKVCRDVKLPPLLVYPFVVLGALLFGRFRIWSTSAEKAAANSRVPILLIHGSEDKYVPWEMSSRIFEACGSEKYLEIFPGAAHGGSCLTDSARYEKVIREFMKRCLEGMGRGQGA